MQMKTTNYLILWESGEEVGGVNLGTSIKIKISPDWNSLIVMSQLITNIMIKSLTNVIYMGMGVKMEIFPENLIFLVVATVPAWLWDSWGTN